MPPIPSKLVVDMSKPIDDPEREKTVPLTGAEIAQQAIDAQRGNDRFMQRLRDKRTTLLAQSDYTELPSFTGDKAAWAAYRQQLRDLPANTPDPYNPVWPTPPN